MENINNERIQTASIENQEQQQRSLVVLYGSQTGCAQEVAERIVRESRNRKFKVKMWTMDEYPRERIIQDHLMIFVCSTTGQGEEPDNMKKFWKFILRKDIPQDAFSHVQFAVFGLGDSSYSKYNFPSKKLFKRLLQLNAKPLVQRGDGDDQHPLGLDGGLDPWLNELWSTLEKRYPFPDVIKPNQNGEQDSSSIPLPSYKLVFKEEKNNVLTMEIPQELGRNYTLTGTVSKNGRITDVEHFQDVRHIEITLNSQHQDANYQPGDVLVTIPQNNDEDVQDLITLMEWKNIADKYTMLEPNYEDLEIPKYIKPETTLRSLLKENLDIVGKPRRYVFELLSYFAEDIHKEKLMYFSSSEGQEELYAYAHRVKRNVLEILQDFGVKVPVDYVFDVFRDIRERHFSIASNPKKHDKIHLTVGIVKYKTKLQKYREGLCTKWMAKWKPGDQFPFYFQKGTMQIPSHDAPCIFVGPGTGIAPLRSLIYERASRGHFKNVLFRGCRNKQHDDLYVEEFDKLHKEGKLTHHTAYSRDQDKKVYVQHLIKEQSELMQKLLVEEKGYLYICGNAKLPDAILDALNELKIDLNLLKKEKRYYEECWS